MTTFWKDYLEIAKFLHNYSFLEKSYSCSFTQDGAYRTAINRAYFAAFCYARDFCEKNGYTRTKKGSDHGKVIDNLRKQNLNDAADILDELRQWRNDCDYEDPLQKVKFDIHLSESLESVNEIILVLNS